MPAKEKTITSIGHWMSIIFVQAIPCIGFIMTLLWAFTSKNESRKNYFKAHLIWLCLITCLWIGLVAAGAVPTMRDHLKAYMTGFDNRSDPTPDQAGTHRHRPRN